MKRLIITLAASALLSGVALSSAIAQETQEGAQEQIIKKPSTNSAKETAPGQQQKSGDTTAREAAPGQQQKSGDTNASEAAPGQQKNSSDASAEELSSEQLKKQREVTGDTTEQEFRRAS